MARNPIPDRPRIDRDGHVDRDGRPERPDHGEVVDGRTRAERRRDDDDDITAVPPTDDPPTDVPPTEQFASMGDVARGAGEFVGGVLDTIGGTLDAGVTAVGRGVESAGEGLQRLGQMMAGGSTPWDSTTSSGGGDDCEDEDEDGGSDDNGGGGSTSADPEFEFDLNIHIQWSTDADAANGAPTIDLTDDPTAGRVVDGGPASLAPLDPLGLDDIATDGTWT